MSTDSVVSSAVPNAHHFSWVEHQGFLDAFYQLQAETSADTNARIVNPIPAVLPSVPLSAASAASAASLKSSDKKGKHQYCHLHGKQKHICKQCGGKNICNHGVQKNQCTKCGGTGICEHGRVRWQCFPCGGKSMCTHGRRKARCKECGGNAICQHDRVKYECRLCKAAKKAAAKLAERDHPESLFALVRAECPESVVQTSQ